MKKTIVIFSFIVIIASCGSNETKSTESTNSNASTTTSTEAPADPEAEKGLALVANSDCFTCHQVVDNATGPSYQSIAERYKGQSNVIDSLAQKIIKGGAGNWGTVPMTAHPSITEEDAKTMVKYVLSLKK